MKKKEILIIIISLLTIILIEMIIICISVTSSKVKKLSNEEIREKIKKIEDKEKIEHTKGENLTQEYIEYQKLTEEEKQELEVIPRKEKIDEKELDNIIEEQKEIEIPSYFNLKDKIKINVGNQKELGICWAFASLKTLETFLELHTNQEYNFSEIKLDYITSNLMYGERELHSGGAYDIFEEYLMRTGPKIENDNEYHDYERKDYMKFIDEENITRVTETINFPTISEYTENGNVKSKEQLEEEKSKFRKAVKTQIINNGAVFASITTPTSINHYCANGCSISHAVAIVGWDDNYNRNNFKAIDGSIPQNNGAYIALNSWGEEWGENGYFYISYEDELVERQISGITSISLEQAQNLDVIKSEKIRQVINENYSYSYIDDKITNLTIKNITNLDLQEKNIQDIDLESLNMFKNLYDINLSNNSIEDISNLKLDNLISIDLSNNNIKNISNLNLKKLKNIILNNNKDIIGIETLKNVESIELENCNIKEIDLKELANLLTLNLSNNPIKNITLPKKLEKLDLKNSNVKNIDEIKNLKKVVILNLEDNDLVSLNFLKNIDEINSINLSDNNLESLNGLENLNEINHIDLSNNQIKNLDSINNIEILDLNLSNNNIDNIDLINGLNIRMLTLSNNKIKDIKNLKSKSLISIDLSNNPNIKDYSSLKNIEEVFLMENNITNAEILETLTNVNYLNVSKNNIGNITPLNKLPNLIGLYLDENKNITGTLDNNVQILSLQNCNLNKFDISKLTELVNINISNNNIDLKNIINSKKQNLFIKANDITLTEEEFNYILNEKDYLNSKRINIEMNNPTIKINIKTPYYLNNLKWLEINKNTKIENGIIENNTLNAININLPIIMKFDNIIEYGIKTPTVIFSIN